MSTRNTIIAVIILGVTLYFTSMFEERKQMKNTAASVHLTVDTSTFKYKRVAYVPVNLPAKTKHEKKKVKLILKIRNTSISDSLYLSKVEYYDQQGKLISKDLDSARLVMPMATHEVHVKNPEPKTVIDNFIVQWMSTGPVQPLIQVVSHKGQNISVFSDNGILIEDHNVH
jgi:hypothetical protein